MEKSGQQAVRAATTVSEVAKGCQADDASSMGDESGSVDQNTARQASRPTRSSAAYVKPENRASYAGAIASSDPVSNVSDPLDKLGRTARRAIELHTTRVGGRAACASLPTRRRYPTGASWCCGVKKAGAGENRALTGKKHPKEVYVEREQGLG